MNGIGAKKGRRKDWAVCREKIEEEGACRSCGDTRDLQAAHTIRRSQGGEQNAESVIPLCAACHNAEHHGDLELINLLTLEEELEAVRVARKQGGSGIARAYRMLTNQDNTGRPLPW